MREKIIRVETATIGPLRRNGRKATATKSVDGLVWELDGITSVIVRDPERGRVQIHLSDNVEFGLAWTLSLKFPCVISYNKGGSITVDTE